MELQLVLKIAFLGICSFWAGLNLGHVLTLWQVEAKNPDDKGDDSDN